MDFESENENIKYPEIDEDEPKAKKFKPSNNDLDPATNFVKISEEADDYSELIKFNEEAVNGTESSHLSESESEIQNADVSEPSDIPNPTTDVERKEEEENSNSSPSLQNEEEKIKNPDLTDNSKNEAEEIDEKVPSDSEMNEIEIVEAKIFPKKKKTATRKDIRKILSVDELDEDTLAAQREEAERLQRVMQKQQNLKKDQNSMNLNSLSPVSIEDVFKRMADSGVTLSDLCSDTEIANLDLERSEKTHKSDNKPDVQIEHEIYTLSSDDEDNDKKLSNQTSKPGEGTVIDYDFYKTSGGVVYTNDSIIPNDEGGEKLAKDNNFSHEESDDDCIVISPPPCEEHGEEKDEDEDNKPDEYGRVLINVGHPEDEPDIFLSEKIAAAIKPHQIGGVRFLYDNVIESLDHFEKSSGLGCILAHSMGLGKTIQAAAFSEIFLRCTSARTVLVIVPINTVQNWSHEFKYWLPSEINNSYANSLNFGRRKISQGKKDSTETLNGDSSASSSFIVEESKNGITDDNSVVQSTVKKLNLFVLNETIKTLGAREKIISEWGNTGGVLLIGYEMYRMLALKKLKKKKKEFMPFQIDLNEDQDELLSRIHNHLVRPGPDLVICDEGHRIKNSGASISQALKSIRTKRRVVLTGYPLQNNLMEYWCMVDFIRPNYLGTKAEFSNMFERPISNGQCIDSTAQDKMLMRFRSYVLHDILHGFVQRRSHLVLQKALPPKQEHVFLIQMSPVQFKLYKEYVNYVQLQLEMGCSTPNPIKSFAVCSKFWNHPDVLYNVINKKQSVLFDDLEVEDLADEVQKLRKTKSLSKKLGDQNTASRNNEYDILLDGPECFYTGQSQTSDNSIGNKTGQDKLLSLEWAFSTFQNYTPGEIENGTKFELLFTIIDETLKAGDKLLVFSQSLLTLDLMEAFLHKKYGWTKGQNYFRLDGSTGGLERERLINEFNEKQGINLFLVSTKAGSLGVNLIGANRVVVFDASWNPCHDCQAVCRIYRYGQKKPCHIYRFVTDHTLEKQIYDRQIHKGGMANRVVDEMNPDCHFNSRELLSTLLLEIKELEKSQNTIFEHDNIESYSDGVIQSLLSKSGSKITRKPFEHESLLIDRKERKLTSSERRQAKRNYESEKKCASNGLGVGRGPGNNPDEVTYPALGKQAPSDSWGSIPNMSASAFPTRYQDYSFGGGSVISEGEQYSRSSSASGSYLSDAYYKRALSSSQHGGSISAAGSTDNWAGAIENLRRKGVLTTQLIVLKKNYILPHPETGHKYLKAGETLELIRTRKFCYIKLSSGQFMAMRRGTRGFAYLETVPFSQYLIGSQIDIFLSTFLLSVSSSFFEKASHQSSSRPSNRPLYPVQRTPETQNGSSSHYNFPGSEIGVPVSFPLPPSLPLGKFSNNQNVQLTNHTNNSGDMSIWKRSQQNKDLRPQVDLSPDIELIQINSSEGNAKLTNNPHSSNSGSAFPRRNSAFDNLPGPSFSYSNGHLPQSSFQRAKLNEFSGLGNWSQSQTSDPMKLNFNQQKLHIEASTRRQLKEFLNHSNQRNKIDLNGGQHPALRPNISEGLYLPSTIQFPSTSSMTSSKPNGNDFVSNNISSRSRVPRSSNLLDEIEEGFRFPEYNAALSGNSSETVNPLNQYYNRALSIYNHNNNDVVNNSSPSYSRSMFDDVD